MDTSHVLSLISMVDELIFSHTGEHLDDLQQAILEGVFAHQTYREIAKKNYRSQKYVKDVAGKLWQTLSAALGEEVHKCNLKSTLQRYHSSNLYTLVNSLQFDQDNFCTQLLDLENQLKQSILYQQAKLEVVTELLNEGLTIEQIARVLKLPLKLVQEQAIQKSKAINLDQARQT